MSQDSKPVKKIISDFLRKRGAFILFVMAAICLAEYLLCGYEFCMRLDQYSSAIFSSIIGVVGTMFGLTAASYAFVWGELKTERESNVRMKSILNKFQSELWDLFIIILFFSIAIIIFNLVLLSIVQHITSSALYYSHEAIIDEKEVVVSRYYNEKYSQISTCAVFDLFLSIIDILCMGIMNYMVFSRQIKYQRIAGDSLSELGKKYDLSLNKINKFKCTNSTPYDLNSELSKIHYLEMLVNRIMKNHENEGDLFRYLDNQDEFLGHIISLKLKSYSFNWNYLQNEEKSNDLKKKCSKIYEIFSGRENRGNDGPNDSYLEKRLPVPVDEEFVKVYSDLIEFRNNQLICSQRNIQGTMLKCTIKKRLLLFLMSHERFDGMDLANVSLSGADLSYSNFSNCNLKGVKLKGTNCMGADFSNSRIPGMYFSEIKKSNLQEIQSGDVEISFKDDGKEYYDEYTGHQPTCLEKATFANSDVSRMKLICSGEIDTKTNYPFNNKEIAVKNGETAFSLRETNFDHAKLFNSEFNNIDLSSSSIFNAQMFNTKMKLVKAQYVNFAETVLTHSIISYSCLANANFQKAVISDSNIIHSDFTCSNLSEANFSNSIIEFCNFQDTICNNTTFRNISAKSEKMVSSSDGCHISFRSSTFRDVDFSNAELCRCNFSSANLLNCNFTGTKISYSLFELTVLNSTIWNSTKIGNSNFTGAIMRDSIFINMDFNDCRFENCDFSNSIMSCRFTGGTMSNVKLCHVKKLDTQAFKNIILVSVDFTGSAVRKDDFPNDVALKNCKFD